MKNEKQTSAEEIKSNPKENKLTRKAAIKKAGMVTLSAASMLVLLSNPQKAVALSGGGGPGGGGPGGGGPDPLVKW
jgi:ribosomal protein S8E